MLPGSSPRSSEAAPRLRCQARRLGRCLSTWSWHCQTKECKHRAAFLLSPSACIPSPPAQPTPLAGWDPKGCAAAAPGVRDGEHPRYPGTRRQSTHVLQTASAQPASQQLWSLVSTAHTHAAPGVSAIPQQSPGCWEFRHRMLPVSQLSPASHVGSPEHHPSPLPGSTVIPEQGHPTLVRRAPAACASGAGAPLSLGAPSPPRCTQAGAATPGPPDLLPGWVCGGGCPALRETVGTTIRRPDPHFTKAPGAWPCPP